MKRGQKGDLLKVIAVTVLLMALGGVLLWFVATMQDFTPLRPTPEPIGALPEGEGSQATTPGGTTTSPPVNLEPSGNRPSLSGDTGLIVYPQVGGALELPLHGATGWAAVQSPLRQEPHPASMGVTTLQPGAMFTIESADGHWWYVHEAGGHSGWIDRRRAFINLPDVLPSILWRNTNATASVKQAGGIPLPGITGYSLYSARQFNYRFGRYEYIMPGMYTLALGLFQAQQLALANGETLIVNEVFRPMSTQQSVFREMQTLVAENDQAREAVNQGPWHLGWFIAGGISSHQRGAGIDLSLGTILSYAHHETGGFAYLHILEYREGAAGVVAHAPMNSHIHELSAWAVITNSPQRFTVQQVLDGVLNNDVNSPSVVRLQYLMARGGFHPLASEWWHFDHGESDDIGRSVNIRGDFYLSDILSWPPNAQWVTMD